MRATIEAAGRRSTRRVAARHVHVDVKRMLLAHAMAPLPGNQPLVAAMQQHGQAVFGEPIPAVGTPLYTDVRLYVEHGIPGVIYGAGPRTVRRVQRQACR
jgi:succinyl-diaminopimelate desuccinylase